MKSPLQIILFDLDDTLYPRETGLMRQVGGRIETYLRQQMDLTVEQSKNLRRRYWTQYGTTLNGLVVEHQVDAEDYLDFVHDIPLEQFLSPDPQLDRMLARISQRKIIFTNSTTEHASRVLDRLGITGHFEEILDVRSMGYRSKKSIEVHQRALERVGASGPDCMLVEDSLHNLTPAKTLGMTTVLVGQQGPGENNVDFYIPSVLDLGDILQDWEAAA